MQIFLEISSLNEWSSSSSDSSSLSVLLVQILILLLSSTYFFFPLLVSFHYFFFLIFFISWRLITLQYCRGFCHTLTWISHGYTCIPHPDPRSHLPLHLIPLALPSAPGPSTCLMHPTWAGDLFHLDNICVSMLFSRNIPPSPSPTESKSLFYTSVSLHHGILLSH